MGQYEIAVLLFESDSPMRFEEIRREVGNVESTVRTSLHKLIEKELISEETTVKVYKWNPEKDEDDLERVRSYTIDELRDRE